MDKLSRDMYRYQEGGGGRDGQLCDVPTSANDDLKHTTFSPVISRPAAPMRIRKRRGIVADGLVQVRLPNFRKSIPNFENQFVKGESSTNQKTQK